MTMLRNSGLKQLKRLNSQIKKGGGTTDMSSPSEKGMANSIWVHDPIDADKSGKRKVSTFEDTMGKNSVDIPDPTESELKMKNEKMKHINENGPNDSPIEIMRNMKTIANWNEGSDKGSRERNFLVAGHYIETKKANGFIVAIEGNVVKIETTEGIVEVKIKDAVKGYKPEKQKEIGGTPIEGPANPTLGAQAKEGGSVAPKIDAKSTKATDNKISTKNNKVKDLKLDSKLSNYNVTKFKDF